jgi:hypothetical protein
MDFMNRKIQRVLVAIAFSVAEIAVEIIKEVTKPSLKGRKK